MTPDDSYTTGRRRFVADVLSLAKSDIKNIPAYF